MMTLRLSDPYMAFQPPGLRSCPALSCRSGRIPCPDDWLQLVRCRTAFAPRRCWELPDVLWKCSAVAVLIQDSVEELNEFVYSVDANLKLFSLPFISSLLQLQSCLPESIYKYFDNQKKVEVLRFWRGTG